MENILLEVKMQKYLSALTATLMLVLLCACTGGSQQNDSPAPESDKVVITFDYNKQSGYASNQFAVWIEDAEGNFIKTLYATRFTAKGGYKDRADALPVWVVQSNLASLEKPEIDAITSATPKSGTLSYTWDMTNTNGDAIAPGEYKFFVEGNLRWQNRILYSGVIPLDHTPVTVSAEAQTFYEASNEQPALTGDSPENAMIGTVTASFIPANTP